MEKLSSNEILESKAVLKWVVIVLGLLGWVFVALAGSDRGAFSQFQMVVAGILLQILAFLALAMERRDQHSGRALAILLLAAGVMFGSLGWSAPELLALLLFPVGLMALLFNLPIALVFTCLLTLVLWGGAALSLWEMRMATFVMVSIWSEYFLLLMILKPATDFSSWAMGYYQRAREIILESRQQKMELKQTLEDLIHANEQLTRLNTLTQ